MALLKRESWILCLFLIELLADNMSDEAGGAGFCGFI
jgi:hypothetical protein